MKKISIFETTRSLKKYETPTLTVMRIASASLMAGSGPGANDQKDPSLQSSRMDEWQEFLSTRGTTKKSDIESTSGILAVTGASIPVSCSASFLWAAQSPNIPLSSCARCFKHRPLPHDLYIKQLETCRFRKHCVTLQAAK